MSFILPQTAPDSTRIGYKNLFTTSGVTVTASSDQVGWEKENGYDWKSHDWWKPVGTGSHWLRASFGAAKSASYAAISGHNLHEIGGTIKPQYSTNGGSSWNDAESAVAPTTGNTIFFSFTSIPGADWRFLVTNSSGEVAIAVMTIGEVMELPVGMAVGFLIPTMATDDKFSTSVSTSGEHLGNSLRRQNLSFSINLNMLDPNWIRTTWADFLDHARIYPFFFSWDSANHSDEAVYLWVNKKIPKPAYSSPVQGKVSLQVEGKL